MFRRVAVGFSRLKFPDYSGNIQGMDEAKARIRADFRAAVRHSLDARIWTNAELSRAAETDPKTVNDFMAGKRFPRRDTLLRIAEALEWPDGRVDLLLSGNTAVEAGREAADDERVPFHALDEHLDLALERFHEVIAQLAQAEAAVDRAMRQWAIRELLRQRVRDAVDAKAAELGRELTDAERFAYVQSVERPSPVEIAEMVGWASRYDDRDWTRYEMALIEAIEPDYPQDVRIGSAYADLEPFRERVRRLGAIPTLEPAQPGPWPPLSEVNENLDAAATEGVIEESGEFNN